MLAVARGGPAAGPLRTGCPRAARQPASGSMVSTSIVRWSRVLDCARRTARDAPDAAPLEIGERRAHRTSRHIGVGDCRLHPRGHSPHHHLRDRLPAPPPGAPGARPSSPGEPPDAFLALAHDRNGHPAVGRGAPQAPCLRRVGAGSPQPAPGRHSEGPARGHRALPQGNGARGNPRALRARRPGGLDRAQALHALVEQGLLPDAEPSTCCSSVRSD